MKTTFHDIRGRHTQVTVGGDGPPLVYLHSAGGETQWTAFHAKLAERFTVFLPAHPGFDSSEGLETIRDMQDLAWHYVDLFSELKLSGVSVVGFSLGAWLACEMSLLRPELASRLVLVAAAGLHVPGSPMAELFIDDLDKLRRLLFFDPDGPAVNEAMPASLDDPRILLWLKAREATARVGWNPYLHNPRLRGHLWRIGCPALVLWGRQDRLIPLAHGEAYAKELPNARLEVLDDCGHMLPFEKPTEFARAVTRFAGS